ncbi:MAG: hypothetical protein ACI9JD_001172 [Rhodococcus sp. (in: high G+C Gram-positive bacteria)]
MCFEFEHSPDADQIDAVCDQFRDATKSDDADLIAEIDSVVADTNKKVSNPEQIKKYTILEVDFTQETDEFTLTLKLKRNTTLEQNPELQEHALRQASAIRIFTDYKSGSKMQRPQLTECLNYLRDMTVRCPRPLETRQAPTIRPPRHRHRSQPR